MKFTALFAFVAFASATDVTTFVDSSCGQGGHDLSQLIATVSNCGPNPLPQSANSVTVVNNFENFPVAFFASPDCSGTGIIASDGCNLASIPAMCVTINCGTVSCASASYYLKQIDLIKSIFRTSLEDSRL
jgi:hypothetical protein